MTKNIVKRHKSLFLSAVALAVLLPGYAHAQQVVGPDAASDKGQFPVQTIAMSAGENTEFGAPEDNDLSSPGFVVSVDGTPESGDPGQADRQRRADLALEAVDIQVKFDGFDVKPILNVSTSDLRRAYQAGESVPFTTSANYPAWIERSEIRIYRNKEFGISEPVAVVDVSPNGQANWVMPSKTYEHDSEEYVYVLRVYDNKQRFDETEPLTLIRTSRSYERHALSPQENPSSAGQGEDRTAVRNIPVYGGAVTIHGRNVPTGYSVHALGENVPIAQEQDFVVQRILPPGDHKIDVGVSTIKDAGLKVRREINIPSNEWFYVGLADLTVGKRFGNDEIEQAQPEEFDDVYTKGRLAFYLKGKIKGRYILTAAADTGEDDIDNLFKGLDSKDPRQFLKRIDPERYYPVYGDDSTIIEDAPTRGKFYVRLERGDSHVMWGNFKNTIAGNQFLRNERALYGANAVYRSEKVTSFGERRFEAGLYAAQPGTLPQRDVLRGTGGSAYFLKRQDITIGSETVTVEVRDGETGRVIDRRSLRYGEDYTIDYIQGVIVLNRPLNSSTTDGSLFRDNALGDYAVNLVAQYEYTPAIGEADGYSYGGRAQSWLGDIVRFGVTGMKEEGGNGNADDLDQRLWGADVKLRYSDRTYITGEYAQSRGAGIGNTFSDDGGLVIRDVESTAGSNRVADAFAVKARVDIGDLTDDKMKGVIRGWWEKKEAGFSSIDYNVTEDQQEWGVQARIEATEDLALDARFKSYESGDNYEYIEVEVGTEYEFNEQWKIAFGAQYTDISNDRIGNTDADYGSRTDIAGRISYRHNDDLSGYVFGQLTVDKDGNLEDTDRIGVGVNATITEKVGLNAEVSYGETGLGAIAGLNYNPTADDHYYVGYKLDPDRVFSGTSLVGTDLGGIVVGSRHKYNDIWSVFNENNLDSFGKRRSLVSTYGVKYTPDARWTTDLGIEVGTLDDIYTSDLDRQAYSAAISYNDEEKISARLKGEVRIDNSEDDSLDRNSYFVSGGLSVKTSEDWRVVADFDAVISDSEQDSILDGDYIEATLGFAYRPVENDRLNALLKYTFLYDLPGADQVNIAGEEFGPRQRSHVFTVDANYDVNKYLTIGGKYGFRIGDVETERGSGEYLNSSAHLAVARADFHVVHNWDVLLEGRNLWSPSSESVDWGALAAVYRHVGNNMKIGVGYNFGSFSDNLTDLTYDDQGVFLNVIGKF